MVPPARDLVVEIAGMTPIAVDRPEGSLDEGARSRGARALDGLGAALLEILDERLSARGIDDAATLVPVYVALPRGVTAEAAEVAWSPASVSTWPSQADAWAVSHHAPSSREAATSTISGSPEGWSISL